MEIRSYTNKTGLIGVKPRHSELFQAATATPIGKPSFDKGWRDRTRIFILAPSFVSSRGSKNAACGTGKICHRQPRHILRRAIKTSRNNGPKL